jgi:hypothetical protein
MSRKENLVLLVGSNPLPNYLAAATLAPSRVVLLYTPETEQPKEHLQRALRDRLNVPAVDALRIENGMIVGEVRRVCRDVLVNAYLNYTGGTKVMATVARVEFCRQDGEDKDASYVDEGAGVLRFDDERTLPLATTALDLNTILELHGFARKPESTPSPNDPTDADAAAVARWCVEDPTRAGRLYGHLTSAREKKLRAITAREFREAPLTESIIPGRSQLPATDWTSREIDRWVKFLRGPWLEQWVATLVREVTNGGAAVHVGVNLTREKRDTELDVLTIQGHRMYLLSCTTDETIELCKLKLFEAVWRARQTGGDLARSALVCFLPGGEASARVRQDVESTWGSSNTPAIFDLADLRAWLGVGQSVNRSSLERWLRP